MNGLGQVAEPVTVFISEKRPDVAISGVQCLVQRPEQGQITARVARDLPYHHAAEFFSARRVFFTIVGMPL